MTIDPAEVDNIVAPGFLARIRSASFVVLREDELEAIAQDLLDDAALTDEEG